MVIVQLYDSVNRHEDKARKAPLPTGKTRTRSKNKMATAVTLLLACAISLALLISAIPSATALRRDPEFLRQVTDGEIFNNLPAGSERKFVMFMEKYGKSYPTRKEYLHRFGIFVKNLIRAAEHQALDPTAVHGVTQFSDLSEEEFERMFMGVRGGAGGEGLPEMNQAVEVTAEEVKGLPERFDWRDKGAVTEVKMQVNLDSVT